MNSAQTQLILLQMPKSGPFHADVVIPPGETLATLRLRADARVFIGRWQAVAWELPETHEKRPKVPFEVEVVRLAHGGYEDPMFRGQAEGGTHLAVTDWPIVEGTEIRVSWRLVRPSEKATNLTLYVYRQD